MSKELEALKIFNKIDNIRLLFTKEERETIKQTLLKAQEQEKVLNIIEEKDVDIYILKRCKTVNEYNSKIVHIIGEIRELTEEEFELLKRWLDEKDN